MDILQKMKSLLDINPQFQQTGSPQIVISSRSDGLSVSGLPSFINPWVADCNRTLLCSDGTGLPISTVHTLVTGRSANKSEILLRQIAGAIRDGYTPIVLSCSGRQGETFRVLQQLYFESAVNYISETAGSGCYHPFGDLPHHVTAEFFYQMIMDLQQQSNNSMLVRNYVNVCMEVLFLDENAVTRFLNGQLSHMWLLDEIDYLYQENKITPTRRTQLKDAANSSQSVSVAVFSIIQDYLFQLYRGCTVTADPAIQIYSQNTPHITILNSTGSGFCFRQNPAVQAINSHNYRYNHEYSLSSALDERKCFFIQADSEIPAHSEPLSRQCFQWYLSKTLQLEMNAKPVQHSRRILFVIENVSSAILGWYRWLSELPGCVLLLNYDDFYSTMSDSQEFRQQLIGKMDRMYFFSVTDEQSLSWTSSIFGTHMVPKTVITEQPANDWMDIIFPSKSYTYDEVEKPWFSTHELQHLGDTGIVYSRSDKIFRARYRENGREYIDKKYRRQRVNFCTFDFE